MVNYKGQLHEVCARGPLKSWATFEHLGTQLYLIFMLFAHAASFAHKPQRSILLCKHL